MKTKIFGALVLPAATVLLLGCNQNNPTPGAAPGAAPAPAPTVVVPEPAPGAPGPAGPPGPEGTPGAPGAPAPAPTP